MSCDYNFDPTHFLIFVKELKNKEETFLEECDCTARHCIYRTIISRSYYSAFLSSEKKIKDDKVRSRELKRKINERGSHNGVIELLGNINPTASTLLSGLKDRRKDADYGLDALIDEKDVDKSIKTAEKIINLLK